MKRLFLFAAAAACACSFLQAVPKHPLGLDPDHPYGILSAKYETPHVKWAKPLTGKKLRVLVLAPIFSQRETVELAQRMDIEFDGWMTAFFAKLEYLGGDFVSAFFDAPKAVITSELTEKLKKPYDVYVIGKLDWGIIPADERIKILENVANGAGLVIINPAKQHKELDIILQQKEIAGGTAYIRDAVPASALAPFKMKKDGIRTLEFGKGRTVFLDYGETDLENKRYVKFMPALTPVWDMEDPKCLWSKYDSEGKILKVPYEYAMSRLVRAVLWSAGRENASPVNVSLPAEITAGKKSSFKVNGPFRAELRDLKASGIRLDLGKSGEIPALPGGDYFLDVWKLDGKGNVLNWKTVPLHVKAETSVKSIELDKPQYESGEAVTGTIRFEGKDPAANEITAVMFDNRGRQISLPGKITKTGNGTAKFRVQPQKAVVPLHRIRAEVVKNGAAIARGELAFPVRTMPRHRFVDIIWGTWWNTPLSHFMMEKIVSDDETDVLMSVWSGSSTAHNAARANANLIIYGDRFGCFGKTKDHIHRQRNAYARSGCMNNPRTLEDVKNVMSGLADTFSAYSPIGYTHGDETTYSDDPDSCRCDFCLAELRKDLKQQFGTIEKLNAAFKTDFKSFEEIVPLTLDEAKKTGNYSTWLAHRRMAAITLRNFYRKTQDYLREAGDPTARAGFDGIQSETGSNTGLDISYLGGELDVLNVYTYAGRFMTRMMGDYARKGKLTGGWFGTYGDSNTIGHNNTPSGHVMPYVMLLNGMNSSWFWVMSAPGTICGYAADMTSLPFFDARTESLKEIHEGIADLILDSEKTNDGVLLLYSEGSRIYEAVLSKDRICTEWVNAADDMQLALEDSGFAFRYVISQQLPEMLKSAKVLLMPKTRVLSDEDAELIRNFVKNGGIVLADIVPGEADAYGIKREKPVLSDLFQGEVTQVGKGYAVLIGDLIRGFKEIRVNNASWKSKLPLKGLLIGKLLREKFGITPGYRIASADGKEVPPVQIYPFENGNVKYVGVLRDYWTKDTDSYKLKFTAPGDSWIYDTRDGKFLGHGSTVSFTQDYKVKLFSLLPGKVKSVTVKAPSAVKPGGTVKVSASMAVSEGKIPSAGAYLVKVFSPEGKALKEYERTVSAVDGKAEVEFDLSWNQAPGSYKLLVRDVATGVTAKTAFEVGR